MITDVSKYNLNKILKNNFHNIPINKDFMKRMYMLFKTSIEKLKYMKVFDIKYYKDKGKILNNQFIHPTITKEINQRIFKIKIIKMKYKTISITYTFYYDEEPPIQLIYDLNLILMFFILHRYIKVSDYSFTFYLLDHKKDFNNFNTGVCNHIKNEVIIYRKEEILKVFIHECVHLFNFDGYNNEINYESMFKDLFYFKSDFYIFESISELWSRTLQITLLIFKEDININIVTFISSFTNKIQNEIQHSLIKANMLLEHLKIEYKDLFKNEKKIIDFNNRFCYYFITSILLLNFNKSTNWYISNKTYQFNYKKKNNEIFYHYIKGLLQSKKTEIIFNNYKNKKLMGSNMSLYELNYF